MATTKKTKKQSRTPSILLDLQNNVVKPENREEFILSALEEGNNKVLEKLAKVNTWIQEEQKWAQAWAPIEEKLFERFRKIVSKKNDFFKVAHIDELQLEYEILIFLGKKNIGKTTEIYRLIEETFTRGKKFIYIRYSRNELEKAMEAFNSDRISPVFLLKDKSVLKFFRKDMIERVLIDLGEDPNKIVDMKFIKKFSIPFVGFAYEFCYCQSYTGGQYDDFELIFYDECLTYDPRNTLRDTHLNNWAAFLSSIARNKAGLKVFLFGNLQGTNNAILDFYGINRDDKFRYIARESGEGCRILFINGGDLYVGFEDQTRAARHAGGVYALKLQGNEYLVTSTELVTPKVFNQFEHFAAFEYDQILYHLKRVSLSGNKKLYAVKAVEMNGTEKFGEEKIFSSSLMQCVRFTNLTYIPTIEMFLERMLFAMQFNQLKYYNEETMDFCHELYEDNPLKRDCFARAI